MDCLGNPNQPKRKKPNLMNKEIINQRLEQLKEQESNLQLQLDEIRFLIQGYQNTLDQKEDGQ